MTMVSAIERRLSTDDNGFFSITGVPRGRSSILIEGATTEDARIMHLDFSGNETVDVLRVPLLWPDTSEQLRP